MSFHITREQPGVYYWFPDERYWENPLLVAKIQERYPDHEICIFRILDEYMNYDYLENVSSNGIRNLARAWIEPVQLLDESKTVFVYYDGDEGFSDGFIQLSESLSNELGNNESKHVLVTGAIPTLYSQQCYAQIQRLGHPVLYFNSWEATCSAWIDSSMTVDKTVPKTKDFICFNRHPRIPRVLLLGLLKYYGLTSRGHITFNVDGNSDENFARSGGPPADLVQLKSNSTYFKEVIPDIADKAISGWNKFPTLRMRIHHHDDEEFWKASNGQDLSHTGNLGKWELDAYNDSHYAIIPETAYLQDWSEHIDGVSMPSHFLTEKTWRHVGLKMPLIVVGRPGILGAMRSLGYKTFHPYINEEYDEIHNDQDRMMAIILEIKRMSAFTEEQWSEWHKNVDPITEHNHSVLRNKGAKFIWSDELP